MLLSPGCIPEGESDIPHDISSLHNLIVYSMEADLLTEIQFIKEVSFGDSKEYPIGRMTGIAVDDSGRIFIGDDDQLTIHAFNPKGSYIKSLGRPGEGPGEFRSLVQTMHVDSQYLYVHDPAQQRINVFLLSTLGPSHTIDLTPEQRSSVDELKSAYLSDYYLLNDYKLLFGFVKTRKTNDLDEQTGVYERYKLYYLMDKDGKIISDKIYEQKSSTMFSFRINGMATTFSFPFFGKVLAALNGNELFIAQSEDFLIKVYDLSGRYLRAVYYPFRKKELIREDAIQSSFQDEVLQNIAKKIQLPDTWPALNDMLIDDENRLWVSTIVEDFDIYEWWVLRETGEIITKFEWPRDKPIKVIRNPAVYTLETEEESGLQQVVRYGFELAEQ